MRILVIDDKSMHRDSARETLVGHELTVLGSFDEAVKALAVTPFPFDAVLVDMMMPVAEETALTQGIHPKGQEVPYGFIIVLFAALRGAKYVALATDINHHKSAMSAALDYISGNSHNSRCPPERFAINGARCIFIHAPFVEDMAFDVTCSNCLGGTACGYCGAPLDDAGRCPRAYKGEEHSKPCRVCQGKGVYDAKVYERKDWSLVLAKLVES